MEIFGGMSRRPALAAAVAVVCVLAGVVLVSLLGSATAPGARERVALERQSDAPVRSHAHGPSPATGRERELRAMETLTLGAEHAKEHALMRRAMMRGEARTAPQADTTAATTAAIGPPGDPAEVGRWLTEKAFFPITAIHAAMLPTGKVMIFTYPIGKNEAEAWLWDPVNDPTGAAMVQKNPPDFNGKPANIWCAGQTFTADGELVVFGGNLEFPLPNTPSSTWKGLNKVFTFDPFSETWHTQPDMAHGRWYPTGIRMADGRIPIISGLDEFGNNNPSRTNPDVEVFTPPATIGGQGTINHVGVVGGPGEPPIGGLYPHMFAMPSGRTLIAGPAPIDSWFFTGVNNPYTWSDVPDLLHPRSWGTSVLLPGGASGSTRVMALGGTDWSETPSTNTTEVFDETNVGAGWKAAQPNHIGRGHANTVLLPDGSMVQVGGGVGRLDSFPSPLHATTPEQRQIELWDPVSGDWQLGPAQSESRAYHSTALLLPDARVLSAGDEWNGDGSTAHADTGEIYEPPYLFRGARPTIGSAPDTINVGASFEVLTPDTNVTRAALVAPGAVTHGVDMNQRYVPLVVTPGAGRVTIGAPPSANVAPPGWYMLFLLNDQGVPSVAKFVRLQPSTASATIPPSAGGSPAAGTPKNAAPAITGLKLSRATFRKGADTTLSFRLSEAARVSLTFERKLSGRRVRGRCVRPTAGKRANCTRYTRAKTLRVQGKAGANTLLLRARLLRTLAVGRYRLTLLATDATGKRSAPSRTSFRLLAARAKGQKRTTRAAALGWF